MNLTNTQNLPEPLVRAIQWSDRDREGCDYTMTELIQPARIRALENLHRDEITEDASERLWALMGSAGHEVLRRSAQGLLFTADWVKERERERTGIVEERAIVDVKVDGKTFKVGGRLDYGVGDKTLFDYKFTSVWAAKEGPRDEWVQQLNCYRWLASFYGVEFDKLQIVCIFRDWSRPKASREKDYPQSQVKVLDIAMWHNAVTLRFIGERIEAHEAAKTTLPLCTPEETWEKPEVWAVKKIGHKRAVKLYDNFRGAGLHAGSSEELEIEHRPGERPRCESYCRCAPFCDQWKAFQKANT